MENLRDLLAILWQHNAGWVDPCNSNPERFRSCAQFVLDNSSNPEALEAASEVLRLFGE